MARVGERIELDFPIKGVVDGAKWTGSLSDLITRPTVVSVYMRNNTGSCDKQVQQLVEVAAELDAKGVGLVGLSKDTAGSHAKYSRKVGAIFPLVSDPDHDFAKAVGSLVEKKMYGKTFWGPTRSAYLIVASGELLGEIEKVDAANHADQLRELVSDAVSS